MKRNWKRSVIGAIQSTSYSILRAKRQSGLIEEEEEREVKRKEEEAGAGEVEEEEEEETKIKSND